MKMFSFLDGLNYKKSAFLFVLCLIFFRPTFLGQEYTIAGAIILGALSLFLALTRFKGWYRFDNDESMPAIYLGVAIGSFWFYCLVLAFFIGDSDSTLVLKSTIAGIGTSVIFSYLLSSKEFNKSVFHWFVTLHGFLAFSIVVTFILLFFFADDQLTYFRYEIKGYSEAVDSNGQILFPFSPLYGVLAEYNIYRFLGIYRESGIAQMFFCWAGLYGYFTGRSKYLVGLCFLGGILTASSSVIVSILLIVLVLGLFRKYENIKMVAIYVVILVFFLFFLWYAPGIGLNDKQVTHDASFDDRFFAMSFAFENIETFFIGHGLYAEILPYENIGINAISYIYFIGVFGFLIYSSLFFIVPSFRAKNFRKYFALSSIVLVNSLFFQPLIDAPLCYFLLFAVINED